jgi:dihydroxy-acid dehydratase
MRSDSVTRGIARAPHRSLFKALGFIDEELSRPLVGLAVAKSDIVPGHLHLDTVARAAACGVRLAGGVPLAFPVMRNKLVQPPQERCLRSENYAVYRRENFN